MMILLSHAVGFVLAAVFLRYLWIRRAHRKRLVRAALAVINNHRQCQLTADQMARLARNHGIRAYTRQERTNLVMHDLIEATKHVN